MTKLNDSALHVLAEAGITEAEWIAYGSRLDEVTDEAGGRRWVHPPSGTATRAAATTTGASATTTTPARSAGACRP